MRHNAFSACAALALALLLARCSATDVCAHTGSINATEKAGTCAPDSGLSLDAPGGLLQRCQAAISGCSETDKEHLGDTVDCLNSLPPCTPETQLHWQSYVVGCAFLSASVSQPCVRSIDAAGDGGP